MNRLRLREIGISSKRKGISCMHQVVSTMSCSPPKGGSEDSSRRSTEGPLPQPEPHSPGKKANECGGPHLYISYELLTLSPVLHWYPCISFRELLSRVLSLLTSAPVVYCCQFLHLLLFILKSQLYAFLVLVRVSFS